MGLFYPVLSLNEFLPEKGHPTHESIPDFSSIGIFFERMAAKYTRSQIQSRIIRQDRIVIARPPE
jgi:hypothetical protein